ncbi:PGF-CTERM sorting domain-containing protein [Halorubrum aethiopicum]|uniref:PGF-CTERM sorting domain-containing protein n=1 Tax=Halorubrum aethiopicum TaxID=1758255 RepID=UPI000831426D|nr:PGF-CTERM sorting domain-containing protein [Halorubrum aethiopicum]
MHRLGSSPGVRAVVVALLAVSLLLCGPAAAAGVGPGAVGSTDAGAPAEPTGTFAFADDAASDGPTGSLGGSDGHADVGDEDTIGVRSELSATDETGTVAVTATAHLPDRVTGLEITLLTANDDAVEADGFEPVDGADGETWEWDGETERPSLTYAMDANVSVEESGPLATGGTYRFVDTGEWALVRTPRHRIAWSQTGQTQLRFARENVVDGEGVASQAMAFLGPYEERVHEGDDQRYRLIVPEAAAMEATPEEVFGAFEGASDALRVGGVDDEVVAIAAPTGEVTWAVRGLQTGDADLWVRDEEPAGTADDVWTHEYVHTRQAYDPEASAEWFTEASATYYAALFALERGATDFDDFQRTLARGERDPAASSVLADPATWRRNADYTKGSLVAGEIDRRIRLASDGRASLATVFRDLNDDSGPVTNRAFLDAVEAAAGESGDDEAAAAVREAAEGWVTTSAVPETWDRDAHAEAFGGTPARIGYAIADDGVRASGEYRNRTVDRDPVRLVTGESLALAVDVSNTGGVEGSYDLSLSVDGETVERRNGTLDADEATTERFDREFAEPGEYAVRVGSETLTVAVSEPADPLVREVTVDADRVTVGGSVTVTATVANDASIPAGSDLEFRVDGEPVGTEPVRLDAGGETTIEREVDVPASGDADVATVSVVGPVDEASTTVAVDRDAAADGSDDADGETDGAGDGETNGDDAGTGGPTDDGVPGFGPVAALVALLSLAGMAVQRGSR